MGLSGHGPNASDPVRDVVAAVAGLCDEALSGDLITGASIADSVVVLARVSHVLNFELARRLTTAASSGALRHTPRVTLTDAGGLSGPDAAALVAAAGFADQHPDLAQAWRAGRIATDTVAVEPVGFAPSLSPNKPKSSPRSCPICRACHAKRCDGSSPPPSMC